MFSLRIYYLVAFFLSSMVKYTSTMLKKLLYVCYRGWLLMFIHKYLFHIGQHTQWQRHDLQGSLLRCLSCLFVHYKFCLDYSSETADAISCKLYRNDQYQVQLSILSVFSSLLILKELLPFNDFLFLKFVRTTPPEVLMQLSSVVVHNINILPFTQLPLRWLSASDVCDH